MNLNDYDISNAYTARVTESTRITPDNWEAEVRHIVLEFPEDDFDFYEGQSIGVLVPGPHDFGNKQHLRLYSIASSRRGEGSIPHAISLCVRRCFYVDEVSGERYPGKASNYLCNATAGDQVQITGPYGAHFKVPEDQNANMVMVGVGTGVAPFRAFMRNIYEERGNWKGKVRLYYGAKSGVELLYRNEFNKDMGLYYDMKTFRAFEVVSPRPAFDVPPPIDNLLEEHKAEVWEMMQAPNTYVYLAGLLDVAEKFQKAMVKLAGSKDAWKTKRAELIQQGRYAELLY
ncbi:MAG: oxidoreductase [Acidobacteria bacterium]|nr:oxidoreductase [Acidobacteriota bacterium]